MDIREELRKKWLEGMSRLHAAEYAKSDKWISYYTGYCDAIAEAMELHNIETVKKSNP